MLRFGRVDDGTMEFNGNGDWGQACDLRFSLTRNSLKLLIDPGASV